MDKKNCISFVEITTKQVPAVKIGILKKEVTLEYILMNVKFAF